MATENKQQLLEELVLLVMYLSSWTEKNSSKDDMPRAWKGYDFAILDLLKEKGLIDFFF